MKGILRKNRRLFLRSLWIIRLRWIAIISVILAVVGLKYFFQINLEDLPIYIVCFFLILENLIAKSILLKIEKNRVIIEKEQLAETDGDLNFKKIKKINNIQIFIDLIALTIILYFTGGVDNPFIYFYFFHVAIASVLLSQKETFIHASFAIILFLALTFLVYFEIIPYHGLYLDETANTYQLHLNDIYVIKRTVSFVIPLVIIAFLVSSIGSQLQIQEEKHTKALKQLEKKDDVKNEYVLRVTHDLKGHLAAIQSNLSVINSRILGAIEKKYEGFIERAYKRTFIATHFVRDLLKITQLRMHDKLENDIFPIKETLINAINNTITIAETKSIKLNHNIEENLGNISGDKLSIQEVIGNIILNAIKYTHEHGSISFTATSTINEIQISVIDTGVGIPKEEIPNIFDEFYRASNVKKVVEDGTGLGLTIVKKVIVNHGGKIWAESELGKGSVFTIVLPKIS